MLRSELDIGDFGMSARRVWVAGHKGMVGSAIARCLAKHGDEVLEADRETVDLRNQSG